MCGGITAIPPPTIIEQRVGVLERWAEAFLWCGDKQHQQALPRPMLEEYYGGEALVHGGWLYEKWAGSATLLAKDPLGHPYPLPCGQGSPP